MAWPLRSKMRALRKNRLISFRISADDYKQLMRVWPREGADTLLREQSQLPARACRIEFRRSSAFCDGPRLAHSGPDVSGSGYRIDEDCPDGPAVHPDPSIRQQQHREHGRHFRFRPAESSERPTSGPTRTGPVVRYCAPGEAHVWQFWPHAVPAWSLAPFPWCGASRYENGAICRSRRKHDLLSRGNLDLAERFADEPNTFGRIFSARAPRQL
jgi:hypothetical protein